jgi:hypothetical protein
MPLTIDCDDTANVRISSKNNGFVAAATIPRITTYSSIDPKSHVTKRLGKISFALNVNFSTGDCATFCGSRSILVPSNPYLISLTTVDERSSKPNRIAAKNT